MSASQSHLGDYGYDVVVAVTQDSITDAVLSYLDRAQPIVAKCWTLDSDKKTAEISYEELKEQTGVDPFAEGLDQAQREKLARGWIIAGTNKSCRFHMGFKAQMGKPPGVDDDDLPDIVTLGTDPPKMLYRLLCKQFIIVTLELGPGNVPGWTRLAQASGVPWIFDCTVNLSLKTADPNNLTADVRKRLQGLPPDSFSVQELLFDLGAGTSVVTPDIKDAQGKPLDKNSPILVKLQEIFIKLYFEEAKKAGSPILRLTTYGDAAKARAAPSPLGSMGFNISPPVSADKPGTATLNYLAMLDNTAKLPAVKAFDWTWTGTDSETKWVETGSESGVFALNRSEVVKWLTAALQDYVQRNCWRAHSLFAVYDTRITNLGAISYGAWIGNPDLSNLHNVVWNPPNSAPGNEEYLDPGHVQTSGSTLATWTWRSDRIVNAGYWSNSALTTNCHFDLSVRCEGTSLIVDQTELIYWDCEYYTIHHRANIVDRRLVRQFNLDVAVDGTIVLSLSPNQDKKDDYDRSQDPRVQAGSYWDTMKGAFDRMWTEIHTKTDPVFSQLPLAELQQNVFPNGKTFHFKNPGFSKNQDLTAHITYPAQS